VDSLNEALHALLERDSSVYVLGQDIVDPYGGAFKVTRGLSSRFPERVWSTPISEAGIVGVAAGLALAGLKSVVEIMFGDFLTLACDQIVNQIAKTYFLSAGRTNMNVVIRTPMGGGRGYGATHSQSLETMFLGIPGLNVVAVSPVLDAGALLQNAIECDPNPVLFIENKLLYRERIQPVSNGWQGDFAFEATQELYPSVILNPSENEDPRLTIASYGRTALMAMEAVLELFMQEETVCEVVVVSQLAPVNVEAIQRSAGRSGCVLVVEEAPLEAGWGAEVIAQLAESGFRGPVKRVGGAPCHIPSSKPLEEIALPSVRQIRLAMDRLLEARFP
jgi:pyruvate/2-oxoglutarate/acetoin dehydrogenase E1 component